MPLKNLGIVSELAGLDVGSSWKKLVKWSEKTAAASLPSCKVLFSSTIDEIYGRDEKTRFDKKYAVHLSLFAECLLVE